MLSHAMYVEHMPPNELLEAIRQAINQDDAYSLTLAQTHDLWDDRSVNVDRAQRDNVKAKEGKSNTSRKRGVLQHDRVQTNNNVYFRTDVLSGHVS